MLIIVSIRNIGGDQPRETLHKRKKENYWKQLRFIERRTPATMYEKKEIRLKNENRLRVNKGEIQLMNNLLISAWFALPRSVRCCSTWHIFTKCRLFVVRAVCCSFQSSAPFLSAISIALDLGTNEVTKEQKLKYKNGLNLLLRRSSVISCK